MAAELTDELAAEILEYLRKSQNFKLATKLSKALATQQATQGAEPVFLVATGEVHEGQETYTRHDGAPPPLCDFERLYTAPTPTAEVEKNAARYDWLRANYAPPSYGDGWDTMDNAIASGGAAMDQAIDAALQSDQAQAGKGE